MHLDVDARNLKGDPKQVRLQSLPDRCPRCHVRVLPKFLVASEFDKRDLVQAVFQCAHHDCEELFLGTYACNSVDPRRTARAEYVLRAIRPQAPQKVVLPELIQALSPSFCLIYQQAMDAEKAGLDQLVGMGLRKSLEFLIKDAACQTHPDKADEIKATALSVCINTYVSDPNLKDCATRAIWLGNDETHYVRKWETKDIEDLKVLVRLSVNWLENSLLTAKYLSEMGQPKSAGPAKK